MQLSLSLKKKRTQIITRKKFHINLIIFSHVNIIWISKYQKCTHWSSLKYALKNLSSLKHAFHLMIMTRFLWKEKKKTFLCLHKRMRFLSGSWYHTCCLNASIIRTFICSVFFLLKGDIKWYSTSKENSSSTYSWVKHKRNEMSRNVESEKKSNKAAQKFSPTVVSRQYVRLF